MAELGGSPRRPQRVLVVMPAWNEELVITQVLAELAALPEPFDVLVVDDGSTDRTAAVAECVGAAVLQMPFNVGVGGAMRAGLVYAQRHGYDGVVQVDADGQHDPAQIDHLLDALTEVDVAVGSRFASGTGYQVRGPRRWAMRLLARSLSRTCRTRLTDVTSGFRATGPRAIGLLARYYPSEYLGDTVESLVVVQKAGLKVREVPVTMRPRAGGTPSQSPLKATIYLGRAVLVLVLAVIRSHPEAMPTDVGLSAATGAAS
jgi:glycosyltransferase involved in cell wall biosynthesis